ncbi:glycosyl hydrolase [Purpureocillium lavendulum]|uniref:Glycosyl hydrolase n=1 Tax=Purpureocillium lavendulum TaxID=1247861 RepID=A0AB34FL17_9HYPO|nr:glycosyl hydrolase [Purpureocillium lavendulum]
MHHHLSLRSLVQLGLVAAGAVSARNKCSDVDILAGQHVVYSWPSSSQPPQELLDLTRQGLVGGVILFGENMDANTTTHVKQLKDAYDASPAPGLLRRLTGKRTRFFVSTDQEGGYIRRIKDGEPKLSAKQMGAAADPAAAGEAGGAGAAATLKQWQHNVNLAPVLDVFRQPKDFTDYWERSFGNTSAQVVAAAVPFLTAMQAAGVAGAAKHFPGLGAASHEANTDLQPVTLTQPLDELRAVDMAPYKAAIAAGIDMVMTSWALYPALDAKYPAGLSRKWVQGELRGRLGFKGVTITDAMEAGAISGFGGAGETGLMAKKAGMDLLLASQRNVTQGEVIRKAIVNALKHGHLDQKDFDAATRRIASMRSKIAA